MKTNARPTLLCAALFLSLGAACSEDDATGASGPASRTYEATIRTTSYGVPHVEADDWGDLGFGHGYVVARDHLCTLADMILKSRGERSLFYGRGDNDINVLTDFGVRHAGWRQFAEAFLAERSLAAESEALVYGYAAGYNRYLEETDPSDYPPQCAGAEWVRPISAIDLLAYDLSLVTYAGTFQFASGLAEAQPPGEKSAAVPRRTPAGDAAKRARPSLDGFPDFAAEGIGSNGWAIGAERSATGNAMVLGNPHFPWEGELLFHEIHLKIPGEFDMYGAALVGQPIVGLGFNQNIAWTHTVTASRLFTAYEVQIDPEDVTRYIVDGESRPMTSHDYSIEIREEDGSVVTEERTLWRTHYGPIVTFGPLGWTPSLALTFRDANLGNVEALQAWVDMGRADSLDAFEQAFANNQGIPFVNTIAAGKGGDVLYIDGAQVPRLSQAAQDRWKAAVEAGGLEAAADGLGFVLLDGSDSANEWQVAPGSRVPGVVPFTEAPKLRRRDFVANANDSHWLSNPDAPLTGYSEMYGGERTPRTPRTRMNLRMLTETGPDAASGEDGLFTREELMAAQFSNRALLEELLRDAVLERCAGQPGCDILAAWDGRHDIESRGACLWREFLGAFDADAVEDGGELFSVAFDPDDPVNTPRDLTPAPASGADPILEALADALDRLDEAGIAPDATFGSAQYTVLKGERIPLHGGTTHEGSINIMTWLQRNTTLLPSPPRPDVLNGISTLTTEGYPINYGASWLMAAELTDAGPDVEVLVSYSQSEDSRSPHFKDQTELFAQKQWRRALYTDAEIMADPNLVELTLTGSGEGY